MRPNVDSVLVEPSGRFPTTRWSRVAAAAEPDPRGALAELCSAYWFPVYAFIRRRGHGPDDCLDLTQQYFTRLLEKGTVVAADPARGRFRTFLLTDCSFFLANSRDRAGALKRGGGRAVLSIDARDAEGRFCHEPAHDVTPERLFGRDWALSLLARALDRLAIGEEAGGRRALFEQLQGAITGGSHAVSYAEVAAQLAMTEAAVQQAVSRLRKRYREALRAEIVATLDDPSDLAIEAEIRDLFDALAR
jgi:DNA-directed RNA polymerase specialized sigma24 family protein